jgi:hypothetical protein
MGAARAAAAPSFMLGGAEERGEPARVSTPLGPAGRGDRARCMSRISRDVFLDPRPMTALGDDPSEAEFEIVAITVS